MKPYGSAVFLAMQTIVWERSERSKNKTRKKLKYDKYALNLRPQLYLKSSRLFLFDFPNDFIFVFKIEKQCQYKLINRRMWILCHCFKIEVAYSPFHSQVFI